MNNPPAVIFASEYGRGAEGSRGHFLSLAHLHSGSLDVDLVSKIRRRVHSRLKASPSRSCEAARFVASRTPVPAPDGRADGIGECHVVTRGPQSHHRFRIAEDVSLKRPVILLSYLIEVIEVAISGPPPDSSCRATTGKSVPGLSVADASSMFNTRRDSRVDDGYRELLLPPRM